MPDPAQAVLSEDLMQQPSSQGPVLAAGRTIGQQLRVFTVAWLYHHSTHPAQPSTAQKTGLLYFMILPPPPLTPVVSSDISPLEDTLDTGEVPGQLVHRLKHPVPGSRVVRGARPTRPLQQVPGGQEQEQEQEQSP